jgi:hypothetical protein
LRPSQRPRRPNGIRSKHDASWRLVPQAGRAQVDGWRLVPQAAEAKPVPKLLVRLRASRVPERAKTGDIALSKPRRRKMEGLPEPVRAPFGTYQVGRTRPVAG